MKKVLWLAVPIILIIAFLNRETLVAQPSVPNTGSDMVAMSAPQTGGNPSQPTVSGPTISILPATVLQGDPAEIVLSGVSMPDVKSLTYNGRSLGVFLENGNPAAVVGIDLKQQTGSYPVVLTLANGKTVQKNLVVGTRQIATAPLGIPASLGGNTEQAAQNLVNQLAKDNAVLDSVPTVNQELWQGKFAYPVTNPVITDTYGYTRDTVNTTISHKGTDFHAPPGTPVMAMNSGVVRVAQSFVAYGNTVIIDHGFGIQTLYMHMSELDVKVGDAVTKGQVIGRSGETGYAEGPHLHISVKIGGISIDPEVFLKLF